VEPVVAGAHVADNTPYTLVIDLTMP
jgi:hypothetical protein